MSPFWVGIGSLVMFLGVAIGAFAAHGLRNVLSEPMKTVFETGVRYQFIHGLALFIVAWLSTNSPPAIIAASGWCFLTGIFLFSGSLYILSLTGIKAWGAVTPLGGLAFLIGWGLLGAWAFQAKR